MGVYLFAAALVLFKSAQIEKYIFCFSGGIFCENSAATCGTSGSVSVGNHNYVITHVTHGTDNTGELGFKLTYLQLPCSAGIPHN